MGENLLETMLEAAARDQQTVTESGASTTALIEGVTFHDTVIHYDDRGTVVELYDQRWNWHPDPIVFTYAFTIEPGVVKGWGLHKLHEDRYFVVEGAMEVVMFDPRPNSLTFGKICRVVLSADRPRMMNVPRFVWHADHNFTSRLMRCVSFPTAPYDHVNPDKYRLPLDTPLIPFRFEGAKGW
jgi:dTDP-4-dehydrorhamnose 3,5-epimerase